MYKSIKDYQWPSSFLQEKKYIKKKQINNSMKLRIIENFFKKQFFEQNVFLFPSARSCIGLIIRYLKINRSNEVFVNKWVSHCIFNTVGAYSNITTKYYNPDLSILVHKWGNIQKVKKSRKKKIIEDSVDSIILNKKSFFINNGDFEIFSLPKIIGSVTGGLVVSKDKNFFKFCKDQQKKNKKLGIYQSEEKFKDLSINKKFSTWLYHESWNTYTDCNSLDNIISCLKNFKKNKEIILKRNQFISKNFKLGNLHTDRIGPVIIIPFNKVKNFKKLEKYLLIRHINKNKYSLDSFKKVFILPTNFKITDKKFLVYIDILNKCLKKNAKKK